MKEDKFIEAIAEDLHNLEWYCVYWKVLSTEELLEIKQDLKCVCGIDSDKEIKSILKQILYNNLKQNQKNADERLRQLCQDICKVQDMPAPKGSIFENRKPNYFSITRSICGR